MKLPFLDLNDGEIGFPVSDNVMMKSDGGLLSKISNNAALDLKTGEIHLFSSFGSDSDE